MVQVDDTNTTKNQALAGVVKLADTLDLGSSAARRAGSTPVSGTHRHLSLLITEDST